MILFGRKLGRDLREHWSQFIAVSLMAGLSVLIFSGLEGGWRGIQSELDSFAQTHRMPDAWITGSALTAADVDAFTHVDGVGHAAKVTSVTVTRGDALGQDELTLSTYGGSGINAPLVTEGIPVFDGGEASESSHGVWLDESYAGANELVVGDEIEISRQSATVTLLIEGLVQQPDKIAYTGSGLVAPDPQSFGYGIVGEHAATALAGGQPALETIIVEGNSETIRSAAPVILGDRYASFTARASHPFVATAYERVTQIQSLSYLFSSLFLLVAVLSIFTSIRRLTDMQRGEVATLKALGHSNTIISAYFTSVGVVAALSGILAGLSLTPMLSRYVLSTQKGSFKLPDWSPVWTPGSAVLPLVLILVCVLASWSATAPMRRATPAEGMRPDVGRARRTPLERFDSAWQRLRYGSRWALRDATGNPVRVVMGVIATTGCMMLLFTGFGMPDTLTEQIHLSYSQQYRYNTRLMVSPLADQDALDQIRDAAGPGQWIRQAPVRIDPDDGIDHTLTVLGDGDLFRVLARDGGPLPAEHDVVITDRLANRLAIGVGDTVMITAADGIVHDVTITGTTTISEPQGILLSQRAWDEAGGEFVPTGYLTESPVGADVLELPQVTGALELEEQRANARALVDSLTSVFTLIKAFAIILAVVVLYNLGALSFTERVRDYATLRVLGFHYRELRSLASRENTVTTLVGWLLGIPAGWWFLNQYIGLFSTDRASYLPNIAPVSLAIASAITIVFAMTATLLLTRRIKGIDMTSALKGVE